MNKCQLSLTVTTHEEKELELRILATFSSTYKILINLYYKIWLTKLVNKVNKENR